MPRLKLFTMALEGLGINCQEFLSVVDSLKLTHQTLQQILSERGGTTNWNDLIMRMDLMMQDSKKVLDDCVEWAWELDSKDCEKPFKEFKIDVVQAEERDFREWIQDLASLVCLATPYVTEFLY